MSDYDDDDLNARLEDWHAGPRRLALVPEKRSTPIPFMQQESYACFHVGCPEVPTELVNVNGDERCYCQGHARLEKARPPRQVVIDPERGDDWLAGWEAHRRVMAAAPAPRPRPSAPRRDWLSIAVVLVLVFIAAFLLGVHVAGE